MLTVTVTDRDPQRAIGEMADTEVLAGCLPDCHGLLGITLVERSMEAIEHALDQGLQGQQIGMCLLQLCRRQRGDLSNAHFSQRHGLFDVDG